LELNVNFIEIRKGQLQQLPWSINGGSYLCICSIEP
jgi:hypothetical protein